MESYGELLRNKREEKELTFEQIEKETTISKNFIEALEEEKVEAFPGEPYFVGFLKNYCEYLGLDTNNMMNLYYAKKIQETPAPIELLQPKKSKILLPLIVFLMAALLVALSIYLYTSVFKIPEKKAAKAAAAMEKVKIHKYEFSGEPETRRIYKGDQLIFPEKGKDGKIIVTVASTLAHLEILLPSGNQIIELSEERDIDIDGDTFPDYIIYLSDVSDFEESHGAEVRILEKKLNSEIEIAVNQPQEMISSGSQIKQGKNMTIIHEDTRAYPFTMHVTFRGTSMFRYKLDRQNYVQNYYKNKEEITVSANNAIRLWSSNINSIKIQIIAGLQSYDLEVGKAGQVKVEDIKWIRDNDGKYKLVILDVE